MARLLRSDPPRPLLRAHKRRGYSLVEGVAVALLLSFAVACTAALMGAGERQQRLGRGYSQVQTDLREALRRATRGIRHGYRVVGTSSDSDFAANPTSGSTQAIVYVATAGASKTEARYHRSNGTFYVQRADQPPPGTALITGVTALSFNYYRTVGSVRTTSDAVPANATEVRIRLTARREAANTPVEVLVNLRNGLTASM